MGRNDERRHRNDPGPVSGLPLKVAPGVGEHRGADGVLRRYLDPGATLFRAPTARRAVNTFVRERAQDLGTDGADLREVDKEENEATLNVRYQQFHEDVPIFGATLQVVADARQAAVVQVENTTELDVSDAPDASEAMAPDVVEKAALAPFEEGYKTASVVRDNLVYLRDTTRPPLPEADRPTASVALLKKGKRRPDGKLHLVHDLIVETSGPFEHFRVVVDAVGGKLLWVEVAGRYATTATLKVFIPDPVTSSNSATLSSLSSDADLKPHAHEVQAEIKDADDAGKFHLDGDWCRCLDWDDSGFPQPEPTEPSFVFDTHPKDKAFLSANAYYWVDSFARYLRDLGNTTLNAKMVPVDVDPQGAPTADKSEWIGTTNPPRMRFDMNLVPGAADLGIIVHEYTHGVVQWLRAGATTPLEYEHSICDAMAGIYRDRFNKLQHRRTETFPFDNNATDFWSKDRRLDLTQRFDDPNFATFSPDVRTSMLASALWQCYLGMGGSSTSEVVREKAADKLIKVLLEMVSRLAPDGPQSKDNAFHLANTCIAADMTVHNGLHKNVMNNAFIRQGLFPKPNVDVFIADRVGDTGAEPSGGDNDPFWTSPDIWVRHQGDGENEHQEPIINRPNNLYVRVHNRGTDDALPDTFTVTTHRCAPGTGMTWPTHFKEISEETIHETIPAGGSVRVGPFAWTPTIPDHECLIAIVDGALDPAVTFTPGQPVGHDKLVRFDNNVGQRNVYPKPSVLGGQTTMTIRLNGGPTATDGSWELDATAMPPDTQITIRTLSRIIKSSTLSHIEETETGDVRSTLQMKGGDTAVVDGFRLDAQEKVTADVTIDFAHEAVHMQHYDLVTTQLQDQQVAGRLTIEITAVKDRHEWFFGNKHTQEVHIDTCPFWEQIHETSLVPFPRIDLAIAHGYNGCAYCLPTFNDG
ncbi:hypothetical protein ACHGLA_01600 [Streptomyces sp. YH02]|uniref:hypothetical protein n=1 Tax=Streptomyces sp. YH02 TaxID=3256999 RepID=UPI003756DFF2